MSGVTITRHTGSGEWHVSAPWVGSAVIADDPYDAGRKAAGMIRRHRQAHRDGHASCGNYCEFWLPIDEDRQR